MKIPRLSNPSKFVEVIFSDEGDVRESSKFVSRFEFDGKILENVFQYWEGGNLSTQRLNCDKYFLKQHDLDLEKAIFE